MIRPTEEAELRAEQWPDDDTAREYEELAEMQALGTPSPRTEPWAIGEAREALAEAGDDLGLLTELEARGTDWSLRMAEAETTADRVARSFEGIDVDELDTLAHYAEEAESRAPPDDDIDRASEASIP